MDKSKKEILDELKYSKVPADRMKWLVEMKNDLKELRELWKNNYILEKPIYWTKEEISWWNNIYDRYMPEEKPSEDFWKSPRIDGIDRSIIKKAIERRANKIKDEIEEYELYPELKVEKVKVQASMLDIDKDNK
jgi:hypothetical protein